MYKTRLIFIFFAFLLASACGISRSHVNYARESLKLEGKWYLTELNGNSMLDTSKMKARPFIVFEDEELKVTGSSGCNRFFGNYSTNDESIEIGPLGSTKIYCRDVPEKEFFDAMEEASDFIIYEETLSLYNHAGDCVLKYQRTIPQL